MNVRFIFPEYSYQDKSGKTVEVKKSMLLCREMKYDMVSILHIGDMIRSDVFFKNDKNNFLISNPSKINWSTYVIKNKLVNIDTGVIEFYLEYKFRQVI